MEVQNCYCSKHKPVTEIRVCSSEMAPQRNGLNGLNGLHDLHDLHDLKDRRARPQNRGREWRDAIMLKGVGILSKFFFDCSELCGKVKSASLKLKALAMNGTATPLYK